MHMHCSHWEWSVTLIWMNNNYNDQTGCPWTATPLCNNNDHYHTINTLTVDNAQCPHMRCTDYSHLQCDKRGHTLQCGDRCMNCMFKQVQGIFFKHAHTLDPLNPLLSWMPNQHKPCHESFHWNFIACKYHGISCSSNQACWRPYLSASLGGCFEEADAPQALKTLWHRKLWIGAHLVFSPPLFTPFSTCTWVSRITKLKAYMKTLGLKSAHSEGHMFDMIAGPMAKVREIFPGAGARELRTHLLIRFDMHVSKYVTMLQLSVVLYIDTMQHKGR